MARRLRIEYPGAIHHVINRGNYRRDLFENPGAAEAFLKTLFQAAQKYGWQVHAYVLMRNHFHLGGSKRGHGLTLDRAATGPGERRGRMILSGTAKD